METKTLKIRIVTRLLSKTITNNDDANTYNIAKQWIDILSPFDGETTITFNQPDDENRLWFLLESQKEAILSQFSQSTETETDMHKEIAPAELDAIIHLEELAPEDQKIITTQIIAPIVIAEPTPAPAAPTIQQQPAPAAPAPATLPIQQPAPAPTPAFATQTSMPSFFTSSQELAAAAFHDKLCNSLEKAFQSAHMQSSMQFDTVMTRLTEIESGISNELAAMENRMNAKLAAIFKTTCTSANNTEAISAMFNTHSAVALYKPEFTE